MFIFQILLNHHVLFLRHKNNQIVCKSTEHLVTHINKPQHKSRCIRTIT